MRLSAIYFIVLTMLLCSGCAVFNRNNTPALNMVEEHLVPNDKTVRLITSPLTVPIGLAAATVDMTLLHPLSVTRDAWDDTNDILWKDLDWDQSYLTTTVFNAPRLAAMPVIFTLDFLGRSSFDISRRGGNIRMNVGDPRRINDGNREKGL